MLTLKEHIKIMLLYLRSKTLADQTSWEEVPEQSEHLWKSGHLLQMWVDVQLST